MSNPSIDTSMQNFLGQLKTKSSLGVARHLPMTPRSTLRLSIVLLSAGSSLFAVSPAFAGQTWDGGSGTDSNWNTADNWNSNTLPNFASQIVFSGTTRTSTANDLTADTTIGGFYFANSTSGQTFSISGNRITLGADFTANQFTGVSGFPASNTDTIGIAMILNGNRNFNIGQRRLSNFTEVISETGGARTLTKQGTGALQLSNANTYSGATTISAGVLMLNNSLAMQNSAVDTTNSVSGTTNVGLLIKTTSVTLGGLIGNKNFAASGGFLAPTIGSHTAASVTALTLNPGTGASLSYSGTIANIAANMTLTKIGSGTQTLTGVNTYTGTTTVSVGTLVLGNATNTLADTGAINVNGGILALNTNSDTVGAVTLTSGSITSSTGVLTGSSYNVQSGVVSAILGGTAPLTKSTSGTVTLTGSNTYTGNTTVSAGLLAVNGSLSTGTVSVAASAWLQGTGTIAGPVSVSGNLSPGNSPGVLTMGSLTLLGSSTTAIEISDTVRGVSYDGITITGTSSTLGYGGLFTLAFSNTSAFTNGQEFDIFNFGSLYSGSFSSVVSTGFYSGTWSPTGSGTFSLTSGAQTLTFSPNSGDIVVVPEPATISILGSAIGLIGFTIARRRRKV